MLLPSVQSTSTHDISAKNEMANHTQNGRLVATENKLQKLPPSLAPSAKQKAKATATLLEVPRYAVQGARPSPPSHQGEPRVLPVAPSLIPPSNRIVLSENEAHCDSQPPTAIVVSVQRGVPPLCPSEKKGHNKQRKLSSFSRDAKLVKSYRRLRSPDSVFLRMRFTCCGSKSAATAETIL